VHSPQAPLTSSQTCPVEQSVSASHFSQRFVAGLQTGVVPVQRVSEVGVHWTQVLVEVSQAGVVPEQSASLVQPGGAVFVKVQVQFSPSARLMSTPLVMAVVPPPFALVTVHSTGSRVQPDGSISVTV
jgi:hypothetical protein